MAHNTPVHELPHIKRLIDQGILIPTNPDISRQFAEYVEHHYPFVPVTGYTIDWQRVPGGYRLRWDIATNEEVADFIANTPLVIHLWVVAWYRRHEPSFICEQSFAAQNLDALFGLGWGTRYLFGVDRNQDSGCMFIWDDFIEIDGV